MSEKNAMRLTEPRITPLPPSAWSGEQPLNNIGRTLLRRPEAFAAMGAWTKYVMTEGSLPPRQREIVILRIGFLCRSGYEWAQHAVMGVAAGLTPEEVERVKLGAAAAGWSEPDAVLIRMTDELHADQFVSDATWAAMTRLFSEAQRMDAVFAASQYAQLSMILNTFGVQLDEGLTLDPDLEAY
jgi:alkylhydroperoxidase family enzyme